MGGAPSVEAEARMTITFDEFMKDFTPVLN
jgi:hypothetical protein